jgi:hypothetical protein
LRTAEKVSAFTVVLGRWANKMINNITECLTRPRTWEVFGSNYGRKIKHEKNFECEENFQRTEK